MKSIRRMDLRKKFIIVLTILCVCTVAVAVAVGVRVYRSSTIAQYNTTAYQVAAAVAEYFTDEELAQYADLTYRYNKGEASADEIAAAVDSERYQELHSLISILRENINANDIVVFILDTEQLENYDQEADERGEWNPLYYIMDNYHNEEEQLSLGDCSAIVLDYREALLTSSQTGKPSDTLFVSNSKFGYTVSAIYPVVRDGSVAAFVSVEIPMETLQENIRNFMGKIALYAGIVAILILSVEITVLVRTMISPIKLVASEAESFVKNNNTLSDRLSQIHTGDEIQTLSESLLKMELDINDYIDNLTRVTAEKERIGAELDVARQIQADMLPNIFPPFPSRNEFDIFASMNPAKEVGGDFYDFFLVDEDHLALVIADVSGKGVPAALFMVISKTLLKNQALNKLGPAQILEKVNNQLCENNQAQMFVTVWLGILEISTGKMTAANAGHEFPAIRRAGGQYELLKDKHGLVLAGMEDLRYREYEIDFHPGDTLFVYTDGVAEATSSEKQLFGTDRMLEALNEEADAAPARILENVRRGIDRFVGEAEQFDDITMLCLRYFGPENH